MARGFFVLFLSCGLLAICLPALARPGAQQNAGNQSARPSEAAGSPSVTTSLALSYDSDQIGPPTGNYNTPEADGRPGEYYFQLGVNAFYQGDYAHAVAMYKVAASWAYKPAEFNLGLMYFRGEGVSADRALGAAWMVMAAERNTSKYARARDLMVTALSGAEFARTNELWKQLKTTYGDEVAMHRAKTRWAEVKSGMTGSRVGDGAVYLMVGAGGGVGAPPIQQSIVPGAPGHPVAVTGWGIFHGQTTDGSIAYEQFHASDNPYDPRFRKDWTGTATVGPLTPVNADNHPPSRSSDTHNL